MAATPKQPKSTISHVELHTSNSLTDWLSAPTVYAELPRAVRCVETHISCVFLTDRFAYKLKKPVRFEFLDFSTVELRRQACEEEIRLNRRLTHDVYLGLVAVRRDENGRYFLDDSSQDSSLAAVDWLVKMRRLPDEATFLTRIQSKQATIADADAIGNYLAGFYRSAKPLSIEPVEYRAKIEQHVRANRDELLLHEHQLNHALIHRIHAAQLRLLRLQPELFDKRVQEGRIIDGHGDLRPEHIYLLSSNELAAMGTTNGGKDSIQPAIIDCIEFNAEFRHLDIADELSFLATECDFAGAEELGRHIFDQTTKLLSDAPPQPLVAFYRSYRACVRAKVAVLRAKQQSGEDQTKSYAEAQRHLQWAERYDRQLPPPFLMVISGLMGSGKSTLASRVAELFGAKVLATDVIRRELLGKSEGPVSYGSGNYRPEDRNRVYDEMFGRAEHQLKESVPVILDGAFPHARLRLAAKKIAAAQNLPILFIHCRCPEEIALQRIATRLVSGHNPSEARPELYAEQRKEEEPNPPEIQAVEVDTTVSLEQQVEQISKKLKQSL